MDGGVLTLPQLVRCLSSRPAEVAHLPAGTLAPGAPADFVVVDLSDPSLAGASEEDLLAVAVFGMSRAAVRDVYAGGEPVVLSGAAARVPAEVVVQDFRDTMRRLWG